MSSVVSRDARRVAQVRAALQALVSCGDDGTPVSAVFPPEMRTRNEWVRRLMRRLEGRGLVRSFIGPRKSAAGPAAVTWYVAKPGLREAIADEQSVSQLIWPSASALYGPADPVEEEDDAPEEEEEGATTESSHPAESTSATIRGTDRELLEAIVRLCAAIAPAVAGIRADIRALNEKLDALHEAWK